MNTLIGRRTVLLVPVLFSLKWFQRFRWRGTVSWGTVMGVSFIWLFIGDSGMITRRPRSQSCRRNGTSLCRLVSVRSVRGELLVRLFRFLVKTCSGKPVFRRPLTRRTLLTRKKTRRPSPSRNPRALPLFHSFVPKIVFRRKIFGVTCRIMRPLTRNRSDRPFRGRASRRKLLIGNIMVLLLIRIRVPFLTSVWLIVTQILLLGRQIILVIMLIM